MVHGHITSAYDDELQRLRQTVSDMGRIVIEELDAALDALSRQDEEAAADAVGADQLVDDKENDTDAQACRVIALRQPVAADLRVIVGAMKIAGELERIGDHAKSIARRTLVISKLSPLGTEQELVSLGGQVRETLRQVMQAYLDDDRDTAVAVRQNDIAIDHRYCAAVSEILTVASKEAHKVSEAIQQSFIARSLERIGDHCTNIAEEVMYIVDGVQPGDERPKVDCIDFLCRGG